MEEFLVELSERIFDVMTCCFPDLIPNMNRITAKTTIGARGTEDVIGISAIPGQQIEREAAAQPKETTPAQTKQFSDKEKHAALQQVLRCCDLCAALCDEDDEDIAEMRKVVNSKMNECHTASRCVII